MRLSLMPGGRDTASQRAALAVSDVMIVPFAPKSFDIWTLEQVVNLIQEMKIANPDLRTMAVLNKVDYNEKDIEEAKQILQETNELEVFQNTIHERKAFANAAAEGLTINEYKPKNYKAIAEIDALFEEISSFEAKESKAA